VADKMPAWFASETMALPLRLRRHILGLAAELAEKDKEIGRLCAAAIPDRKVTPGAAVEIIKSGHRVLEKVITENTKKEAEIERLKGELRKIDDLSGRAAGALSAVAAIQEIAVMEVGGGR